MARVEKEEAEAQGAAQREEIKKAVARGGGPDEAAALWGSLFLKLDEVEEVLQLVRERALHP